MRSLLGFSVVLLLAGTLSAQNRSGFVRTPGVTRAFPSVVFPGGTSTLPGVQRTTGSVVYPGGGGPQIGVPAAPLQGLGFTTFSPKNGIPGIGFGGGRFGQGNGNNGRGHGRQGQNTGAYAYPVFVGGGYYGGDYSDPGYAVPPDQLPMPTQPQQPNIVVIYPTAPAAPAASTTLYPSQMGAAPSPRSLYEPQAQEPDTSDVATHYLIAFKDHTIYSAVAYWVDGDTLHYFTTGNTHNQASLSLVDRELTARLNKESGLEVKLPPVR